jgi:hypothetical protein
MNNSAEFLKIDCDLAYGDTVGGNHKSSGRNSKQTALEYKSEAFPLEPVVILYCTTQNTIITVISKK